MKKFSFVRGDTFPFKVKINAEATITKDNISTLFVTCRKAPSKKSPVLFQKTLDDIEISDNYIHIVFEPKDTEELEYGVYCFDLELTTKEGYKKTKYGEFEITNETTITEKVGG